MDKKREQELRERLDEMLMNTDTLKKWKVTGGWVDEEGLWITVEVCLGR